MRARCSGVLRCCVLVCAALASACGEVENADRAVGYDVDRDTRARVIEGVIAKLNEYYVFADKAKEIEAALTDRQSRGDYDGITNGSVFASTLVQHLREVSRDKHLGLTFSPVANGPGVPTAEAAAQNQRHANCGFAQTEVLADSIGYVKLDALTDPNLCRPTAVAAMNSLAGVDAIVFDLRDNLGGTPAMTALLAAYLFAEPTRLSDVYWRQPAGAQQIWTDANVSGPRLTQAAVYILTSSRTFSAAEGFAYDLQALKRATVIGEATAGGAHPARPERIDDRFVMSLPYARAINPITNSNWEGTGVQPDVVVPAAEALSTVQRLVAASGAE